jgi:hypothetical protein
VQVSRPGTPWPWRWDQMGFGRPGYWAESDRVGGPVCGLDRARLQDQGATTRLGGELRGRQRTSAIGLKATAG